MSKQKSQITTVALPLGGNDAAVDSSSVIKKYLYHWPLFALFTIIFIGLAYFYLQVASPIYPVGATLEFKSPTASSASLTVNQNSTTQELDPINKPVIVENEIEVMQSKKLIYQVVNELQLWCTYTQKVGFMKSKDLYKDSPVKFQFVKEGAIPVGGASLKLSVKDQNSFTYKDESGDDKVGKFSTPISSSFGTWQLNANANVKAYVDSALVINVADKDQATDDIQKGVKVVMENKDAPFVNLSISDRVPERGKDILNSLLALYLQYATEDKNTLTQKTLKFVDFRLDSLNKELNGIEKKLETYKTSKGMTDIVAQAQGFRDYNLANSKTLNDVEVQLAVISSLEKAVNATANTDRLPPAPANIGDQGIMSLYDRLSVVQAQRAQLVGNTPAGNPMFKSLDTQVDILKNDFRDKVVALKASLQAQKKQLEAFGNKLQSSIKTVPGEQREFNELSRLQESKETIFKFLLEKREQVSLRYASSVSDSEIVDDAHASKVKWPIVPLVYAIALILGAAAAAGLLYARESMNDLITSREQIEEETSIPILGELAYQDTDKQIVVSEGRSKFIIGEQFRVLRTNLYHLHGNNDSGRVSIFTSSVSGEGKSFVSSNLAVTLAYASRKTVILEMDLRKPKVSVNFGLSPEHPGISNYLAEETNDIKSLIQPSGIPGLDVLGCGAILPNPSELLEKDRLDKMVLELRTMYDEIIIDSPPIHLVTDALIIARVADVSLYVVRQGYTHKYELEFVNGINEANRFPKFSIVLNGVKRGASGYGGYGYSYSNYTNNYYNSYAGKTKTTFGDRIKGILSRF